MSRENHSTGALGSTIERHRMEVQSYLGSIVSCTEAAADLFQTIAEQSLRRDRLFPIKNVRAYLYAAAKNAAANFHLAQQAQSKNACQYALTQTSINELGPDSVLEAQQKVMRLNAALQDLPGMTQQIFVLYRLRGAKQEDIASQFGVHVSTVEKHLKRAAQYCHDSISE
ncbi:MAG: sigma-70 family RNA polymerase sigma factor [Pseudomonadota bacterium]